MLSCRTGSATTASTGPKIVFKFKCNDLEIRESFVSQERVSGFPEKGADLRGSPGNFRGSLGNFRGSLGNFRGTSGLLLSSTVWRTSGEAAEKLPGKFGELPGKSGDFPEARGSLTPPQRLAKVVSKEKNGMCKHDRVAS